MVTQDNGGGPDAVEAAVAVLLGSGITAWRIVDRVSRPARNVAAGLLSVVVGPVAAGQTAVLYEGDCVVGAGLVSTSSPLRIPR
jgi:hypothetical protein